MAIPSAEVGRSARCRESTGPADNPAGVDIDDHAAIQLALARGVPGYIRNPQLIRALAPEVPLDQIGHRGRRRHLLGPSAQRQPGQAGTAHQRRDGLAGHDHALAEHELGADPRGTIRPSGCLVHGGDLVDQPRLADRPGRGRPVPRVINPDLDTPRAMQACLTGTPSSASSATRPNRAFEGTTSTRRRSRLTEDLDLILQFGDPFPSGLQRGRLSLPRRRGLQSPIKQVTRLLSMQTRFRDPHHRGDLAD
jgi:hypothetical protein